MDGSKHFARFMTGILALCLNWKEHMAMWLANIGSLLVNIY